MEKKELLDKLFDFVGEKRDEVMKEWDSLFGDLSTWSEEKCNKCEACKGAYTAYSKIRDFIFDLYRSL